MGAIELARTILYSVFLFCAFLTFILAAALTGKTESYSHDFGFYTGGGYYYAPAAELIAAGILALLVVGPLHFFFHRREAPSIFSTLIVEIIVVFVFWMLFLGGAAAMASQLPGLSTCSGFAICDIASALEAFAWLGWISLTALLGLLIFVTITETTKGRKTAYNERFTVTEKGAIPPVQQQGGNPAPMSENAGQYRAEPSYTV
ncbi:hypothetical protein T439DRAFT_326380 [Meredithblackwellia eburnea MCA 4105]